MRKIYFFILMLAMMATFNGFAQTSLLNEGFEGTAFPPTGWTTNASSEWTTTNYYFHGGANSAYANYSYNGHNSYLITPQLSLNGNYTLHFFYGGTYVSDADLTTFTVEISTTGTGTSDFTVLETLDFTLSNYEFDEAEIDLSTYNGEDVYIAFHVVDDYGTGVILDDITVEPALPCPKPTAFTVSIVSLTEVTLSWNGTADDYNVEYGEHGFTLGDGNSLSVSDETTVTIDDLTEGVVYDYYVQADCGDDGTSIWVGPITLNTSTYTMAVTGSDTLTTCGMVIYDDGGPNGDYSLNCESVLVIYPSNEDAMVAITGTVDVENGYDYLYIYDGAGTTGTPMLTYTGVSAVNAISTTGPLTIEFSSDYMICDEGFELTVSCVTCLAPSGSSIMASEITTNSATISWGEEDESGDYQVTVIGPSDTTVYEVSAQTLDLTDLTPASFYTVYIQTVCDDGSLSLPSSNYVFNSGCDAIDVTEDTPWTEDFESYAGSGEQPFVCWATPVTDATYNGPFVYCGHRPSCHSGLNSAELKGSTNVLVLPEFSNDINTLRLSFWATATTTSLGTLEVGVMTNPMDTSTFELVATTPRPGPRGSYGTTVSGWGNFMGPFDFSGVQEGRIALRYTNTIADESWNLDDFTVSLIPDCAAPAATSVTATNVVGHSATISWTDNDENHTNWMVYYKPASGGDDDWQTQSANATSVELTDLDPETMYQVYVVTVCGGNEGADSTLTITFTTTVACPAPYDFSTVDLTAESATVSWVGGSESYTVEYDTTGFTLGTGTVSVVAASSIELNNLEANTSYTLYVYGDCGSEDGLSDTAVFTFTTPCVAIEELPYYENFNSYTAETSTYSSSYPNVEMPSCWSFLNRSTSSSYYPQAFLTSYSDYVVSGNSLFFKSNMNTPLYAILPSFTEPLQNLQITFSYRNEGESEYNGTLSLGYMTDVTSANSFVELASYPQITAMTEVTKVLNVIPENITNANIAFKYTGGNSSNYYLSIDDVVVEEIANCQKPASLAVTGSSSTTVSLSWPATEDGVEYEIAYGAPNFNPNDEENIITSIDDTTYEVGALTSGTAYEFYVRTNCGSEVSGWRGPVRGVPGSYNMHTTGWDTLYTCGTVIYDDGGAEGNYSNNCSSYLVIYPEEEGSFVQITGTLLSEGSNWDYLAFYDGVGTEHLILQSNQTYGQLYTIPTITSTYGPITVYFKSDGSGQYAGFELFTSCVTCVSPTFTAVASSSSEVLVTTTSPVDSWDLLYGEHGFQLSDGTLVEDITGSTHTVTNLNASTQYDFYVRANCGDEEGDWNGPITVTPGATNLPVSGELTINSCGTTLYDDGGPDGDYSSGCDVTVVVNPDQPGMMVHITGTFSMEEGYDYIQIYDGAGTSGTLLFDSEDDYTLDVTSTTGPLTLYFYSDSSVQEEGFELQVTCVEGSITPTCNAPTNLHITSVGVNEAVLAWDQTGEVVNWTVDYKVHSAATWTSVNNVTAQSYSLTNLSAETEYDVRVAAVCGENTMSEYTPIYTFTTQPDGVNEYLMNTAIYPNPTTGQFTIENSELRIENVEVYDVYGKLIKTVKVEDYKAVVDLTANASGIYFARIYTDKGMVTKQIVKK